VGPFGLPAKAKGCCCGGNCIGCCVPTDTGTNAPQDIPFEISAPACAELDGFASVFSPVAPPPSQDLEPCGVCGAYQADDLTSDVRGAVYNPPFCTLLSPPVFDPCRFGAWRFSLHCDTPLGLSDPEALATCCRRLRLGIARADGVTYSYLTASSCSCDPLSAVFDISDLIDVTWTDPGATCAIDGCFPWTCDMTGATLVI